MAHFAQLNENNEVVQVLVVNDDYLKDENGNEVEALGRAHMESVHAGKWIQTSYNNNIRVRYAGIGYTYDEDLDAFIRPKPYSSWNLDSSTAEWISPIPYPTDGKDYSWDEELHQSDNTKGWVLKESEPIVE